MLSLTTSYSSSHTLWADDNELSVASLACQFGHASDDLGGLVQGATAAFGRCNDNGLCADLGGGHSRADCLVTFGHGQHGGRDGSDHGGQCLLAMGGLLQTTTPG